MTTATESFLTQLDKAAEGKSINLIEFEGLLDTIAEKPIEEEVVEEENYAIPEYPMQLDKEDDDGDWVVGDPTKPITGFKAGADTAKVIDKANKDVEKDRAVKSLDDNGMKMESAMSELSAMFEDMTGLDLSEPEPEIVAEVVEEEIIEEPVQPIINIDPVALEEATAALKGLFSDVAGVDLFSPPKEPEPELHLVEEEVVEEPIGIKEKYYNLPIVTPKYEISDVSKMLINASAGRIDKNEPTKKKYNVEQYNPSVGQGDANWQMSLFNNEANSKAAQMVSDVAQMLERHKQELPEEEYRILEGNAVEQTVGYLNNIAIEEEVLTPVEESFDSKVAKVINKVLSVGWGQRGMTYGSGEVNLARLDDVDATNISATHQFLAWDASVSKFVAAEGTTPVGDISGVVAGTGLSGGGTSGTVTLNVEASQTQITALGTIGTGTWQGTAIANAYIGTGINATKLADGSVTNTELQYIGSLTSDAQTQIDNKAAKGFVTAMAMALG